MKDFQKKAPKGLLNDIKSEMLHRGLEAAPVLSKQQPFYYRAAAIVAIFLLLFGLSYQWIDRTNTSKVVPTLSETEEPVNETISIKTPEGEFQSRIGGYIDRLDSKDGTLRIVDYKTGGKADTPPNVASLFVPDKKRSNYIFQTFLYAAIMSRKQELKIAPSLLYIHRAASDDYSPVVCLKEPRKPEEPVTDFSLYEEEFRTHLQVLLQEIFSSGTNFEQTSIEEKCAYCDFKTFCKK